MRRPGTTMATLAVAAAIAAATAAADGLPVGGVEIGPTGVVPPETGIRYVALRAGQNTLAARIVDGGGVDASRLLSGRFTVPAVALDGSAGGLSADGSTLVLIRPRPGFPRRRTALALLDAKRLRVREVVTLAGDFSFDALSPDGSLLYLVQYVDPQDPTRYVVRGYDVQAGKLLPEPVVDPKVFGDVMRGYPLTRAASPDGRWAYTLYDGGGEHPFVHALDTADRRAACIVLDALAGRSDLTEIQLAVAAGGGELHAVAGDEVLAAVDTETLRVVDVQPAAASTISTTAPDSRPWALAAVVAAFAFGALAAGLVALRRLRRRRAAPA